MTGTALALTLGLSGGLAATAAGVPLAWMLGPLLACAVGAMAGLDLRPPPYGRELGQAVVGLAIGVRLTAPVLAATASLLPAMLAATAYVMIVTAMAALLLRAAGRVDGRTAFFATAAAGVVEMANLARERGGDPDAVAVVQAIRVVVVVAVVPVLVFAFGADGGLDGRGAVAPGHLFGFVLPLGLGVLAALGLRRFPALPNVWLLGPMLVGAVATAASAAPITLPWPLLLGAQLALGVALGSRFDRKLLTRLPRVVASGLGVALLLIGAAGLAAVPLSAATGLPYATSFLAVAPAGVTEMVLTAGAMHLDAVTVTAFHVMRITVITATILVAAGAFDRVLRWTEGA